MTRVAKWWTTLSPDARKWLGEHQRDPISWHLVFELKRVGAVVEQPDPSLSVFILRDSDWNTIEQLISKST